MIALDKEALKATILFLLKYRQAPISFQHLETILQMILVDNQVGLGYDTFATREALSDLDQEDLIIKRDYKFELRTEENKGFKKGYYY